MNNTTGDENTAIGADALSNSTTGNHNTATGASALHENTIGFNNTANGDQALFSNDTGIRNTATGAFALQANTTGFNNTANGLQSLFSNISGANNTATGTFALLVSTTGGSNTANGVNALMANTTGDGNTALGFGALFGNTTGFENIGVGHAAGINAVTANHVISIGSPGANVSNSCYIGQIYTHVQPQVGIDPDLVTINSSGRLGRANVSSRRYKHDIKPMHKASEAIYALKPVSFRYHKSYDLTQTIAFGLIAEEVAEVNPDLVGRNPKDSPSQFATSRSTRCCSMNFLRHTRQSRNSK